MLYLRARYYNPADGRFQSRDTWEGNYESPYSLNRWGYSYNNPILYLDPSGHCSGKQYDSANPDAECWRQIELIENLYSNIDIAPKNWKTQELVDVERALLYMTNTLGGSANFQFVFSTTIKIKRAGWLYSWLFGRQGESALGFSSITISDGAFINDDLGTFVVIHEFGHFFDARFDFLSRQEFKNKFWENCTLNNQGECKEPDALCKPPMISPYGSTSPKEDFAETFAAYIWSVQNGSFLNLDGAFLLPADERYVYMGNIIEQIKNMPK